MLRLFAAAREAAGTGRDQVGGATVGEVLARARERYGPAFAQVLGSSRVWLNGVPAGDDAAVGDGDEVAVLPPVSGGCGSGGGIGLPGAPSRDQKARVAPHPGMG